MLRNIHSAFIRVIRGQATPTKSHVEFVLSGKVKPVIAQVTEVFVEGIALKGEDGIDRFYPWPAFQSLRPVDPPSTEETEQ